jgi:hypothetical protein
MELMLIIEGKYLFLSNSNFSLDLNAAETGVQPKQPLQPKAPNGEAKPAADNCSC